MSAHGANLAKNHPAISGRFPLLKQLVDHAPQPGKKPHVGSSQVATANSLLIMVSADLVMQ